MLTGWSFLLLSKPRELELSSVVRNLKVNSHKCLLATVCCTVAEVLENGEGRSTTQLKLTVGHSLEILGELLLENPLLGRGSVKVTCVPKQRSEYPMIDMLVWRFDDESAKRKRKNWSEMKVYE